MKQRRKGKGGRPRTLTHRVTKSAKEGLQKGYTRSTIIVLEDQLRELKGLSEESRLPLKDIIQMAFHYFLESNAQREKALKKGNISKEFITVKEAAKKLEVKPVTVRNYIKTGKLKASKIGKEWYVDFSHLEKTDLNQNI